MQKIYFIIAMSLWFVSALLGGFIQLRHKVRPYKTKFEFDKLDISILGLAASLGIVAVFFLIVGVMSKN